jgi:hypothetical protein
MNEILKQLKNLSQQHDEESAKEWIKIMKSIPNEMRMSPECKKYVNSMTQRFTMNCNTTRFNAYIYKKINHIDQSVSIGGIDELPENINKVWK